MQLKSISYFHLQFLCQNFILAGSFNKCYANNFNLNETQLFRHLFVSFAALFCVYFLTSDVIIRNSGTMNFNRKDLFNRKHLCIDVSKV